MAPALAGVADVMVLDLEGEPAPGDDRVRFLERFIHAAIYGARPDVGAIVHSHSPAVIPFGVVAGRPLRPVFHMAGFIGNAVPVFEIADTAGEGCDMLIRTLALGEALAAALGGSAAVLMRGHGSTCVGRDVREAVYRAVYLEANARVQKAAHVLGDVRFLSPAEVRAADDANAGQVGRAWDLWCREVTRQQVATGERA